MYLTEVFALFNGVSFVRPTNKSKNTRTIESQLDCQGAEFSMVLPRLVIEDGVRDRFFAQNDMNAEYNMLPAGPPSECASLQKTSSSHR